MQMEYYSIFIYYVIAILIAIVLYIVSYIIVYQNLDLEKVSSYECGFNPFEDARIKFDVQFYMVALLFIIFDLEISFLFPWILIISKEIFFTYIIMLLFLYCLTIGFVYEWLKGALDW